MSITSSEPKANRYVIEAFICTNATPYSSIGEHNVYHWVRLPIQKPITDLGVAQHFAFNLRRVDGLNYRARHLETDKVYPLD